MEFVDIQVRNGASLLVEVEERDSVVEAGRAADLAVRGIESFGSAMDAIRDAASEAVERMTAMKDAPTEVTVQFSIQLAAEAGVVVARTAATANMTVSLTWRGAQR